MIAFLLPLVCACVLAAVFGIPDPAVPGVCRELVCGTTAGRQALVGSCWHAPLPTLVFLPFAWLLPRAAAATFGGVALWWLPLVLLWNMTSGIWEWCRRGARYAYPSGLVRCATSCAFLLLCGIWFALPAGAALLLLPAVSLFRSGERLRFPAWLLLAWLPSIYAIAAWMLMNRLILDDSLFFARSLSPRCFPAAAVSALSLAQKAPSDSGVLEAVAAQVRSETKHGRVFVLGYEGLRLMEHSDDTIFTPNLDLHLPTLRRAYARQDLYLLVPRPTGIAAVESVFWRLPDIWENGAQRAVWAGDFGNWRIFEVVQAPTRDQLQEWRKSD